MKLLIVTPECPPVFGGGIVTHYRELLAAYAKIGVEATVLMGSAFAQPGGEWTVSGHRVVGLTPDAFGSAYDAMARYASQPLLRRHLAAASALRSSANQLGSHDIVEVVDWGLVGLGFVAQTGAAPTVLTCHGSLAQIAAHEPYPGNHALTALLGFIEQDMASRAHVTVTSSPNNHQYWSSSTPGKHAMILPAYAPRTLPPERRAGYAVFARFQNWKGVDTLCRAQQLTTRPADVTWHGRSVQDLRSGQPYLDVVRSRYPDVIGKTLRPSGTVTPAEVSDRMTRLRAVIAPSDWDVFNFTVAEAMALGTPVIASRGVGASCLIEHGVNGLIFEAGSAEQLAECLRQADELTEAELSRMGEAARETARVQLDPISAATKRLELFQSLPSASNPGSGVILQSLLAGDQEASSDHAFLSSYPGRALVSELVQRLRQRWFR